LILGFHRAGEEPAEGKENASQESVFHGWEVVRSARLLNTTPLRQKLCSA
jgi:hypothetical protein